MILLSTKVNFRTCAFLFLLEEKNWICTFTFSGVFIFYFLFFYTISIPFNTVQNVLCLVGGGGLYLKLWFAKLEQSAESCAWGQNAGWSAIAGCSDLDVTQRDKLMGRCTEFKQAIWQQADNTAALRGRSAALSRRYFCVIWPACLRGRFWVSRARRWGQRHCITPSPPPPSSPQIFFQSFTLSQPVLQPRTPRTPPPPLPALWRPSMCSSWSGPSSEGKRATDTMDRQLNLNRAETFSFVNPWIRYFLFFFSFLFWVSRVRHQSLRGSHSGWMRTELH